MVVTLANWHDHRHTENHLMRPAIAILVILCLGLGGALLLRNQRAIEQAQRDALNIGALSNELTKASTQRDELQRISLILETNLTLRASELSDVSNRLISVNVSLEKTKNDAQAAAEIYEAEKKKRDAKITELEQENSTLEKQSDDLRGAIGGLEKAIVDTEKKLAASEGDRDFLLKELKRLQAEKAELERQFNDIVELRKQVSRLREELSVARRIEWLKKGIFGFSEAKGGQLLSQQGPKTSGTNTNSQAGPGATNIGLQAELRSDGSATISTPKVAPQAAPTAVPQKPVAPTTPTPAPAPVTPPATPKPAAPAAPTAPPAAVPAPK